MAKTSNVPVRLDSRHKCVGVAYFGDDAFASPLLCVFYLLNRVKYLVVA